MWGIEFNRAKKLVLSFLQETSIANEEQINLMKKLTKNDVFIGDFKNTKMAIFKYVLEMLHGYLDTYHQDLSTVERQVFVAKALKRIFKLKSMPNKITEMKEDILAYANHSKRAISGYSFKECLDNKALKELFNETWDEVISLLENSKPQDLIDAQTKIAENVSKDLAKYDDISDYIVRIQYLADAPLKDNGEIEKIIYDTDIQFLKNLNINQTKGLAKIYMLRDTLVGINSTDNEDVQYKYVSEFNLQVKDFNKLIKENNTRI